MGVQTKPKVGRGTVVSIGGLTGASGGTFVPIESLMQASFTGGAWGTFDFTNFDSGNDEEFGQTTRNNGDVDLKGNLLDGTPGQAALEAAYNAGGLYDFKVQTKPGQGQTTGALYSFSALVTSFFDIPISTKEGIQFSSKLKVSGGIVVTPGT